LPRPIYLSGEKLVFRSSYFGRVDVTGGGVFSGEPVTTPKTLVSARRIKANAWRRRIAIKTDQREMIPCSSRLEGRNKKMGIYFGLRTL
jgi:hypothetical protein